MSDRISLELRTKASLMLQGLRRSADLMHSELGELMVRIEDLALLLEACQESDLCQCPSCQERREAFHQSISPDSAPLLLQPGKYVRILASSPEELLANLKQAAESLTRELQQQASGQPHH